MDNRWKPWTPEEDSRILDNPEASDSSLAMELFRSENAIHCRRAHLAAKMHMMRPEIPVDQCAAMVLADQDQTKLYLDQWRSRKNTMDRFVANRKRTAEEAREEEAHEPARGFKRRTVEPRGIPAASMHTTSDSNDKMIDTICMAIRDEEGQLSHLWNDLDMVPTLIKYYPGFLAYAQSIRGM
jgi:hypothetical protein